MSLVIAIKDQDRWIFGSDKQTSFGNRKGHNATKVWQVKGYKNCCMGGVGYARANQIMQYCTGILDKNYFEDNDVLDEEYAVVALGPTIYATLAASGFQDLDLDPTENPFNFKRIPNEFLFAYKDKCYRIGTDLTVEEVDDFVAIGSGEDIAKGVLYATPDKNPFERIALAIEAASEFTIYVDDSIEVALTDEKEEDELNFYKAVGVDLVKALEEEVPIQEEKPSKKAKEQTKEKKPKKKKEKPEI